MVQKPILNLWCYLYVAQVAYQFLFTVFCFVKTGDKERNIYWSPGWFYFGLCLYASCLIKALADVLV